jgi:hypothetical protein
MIHAVKHKHDASLYPFERNVLYGFGRRFHVKKSLTPLIEPSYTEKQGGNMSTLEKAILLAVQAHQGQKDKVGSPYILHPLRMMLRMNSEMEMMAVAQSVSHSVGKSAIKQNPYLCAYAGSINLSNRPRFALNIKW